MKRDNVLIVADSERDANMLYAVGLFIPDPFIYLRLRGRCHVVLTDTEFDRVRRGASDCRVLPLSRYARRVARNGLPGFAPVIREILREKRVRKVLVPEGFPFGLARQLRSLRIKLKVAPGPIFPERQFKTSAEVKKISAALTMAEVGLAEGIQALRHARAARNGRLQLHHAPLTAERLRGIIQTAVLQAGGTASRTIVACGRQSCDPHEPGHGPLRAGEPIILDVFPRSQKTGYFGDISRTVVKGRASEALRRLYHCVAGAQDLAFSRLQPGAVGAHVHDSVVRFFQQEGYPTRRRNGHMEGFFHGTGHGVGLEIHESPRLASHSEDTLRAGQVVTLEPGLYYPRIGGVRLEDMALITSGGARNLTKFEKVLEV